YSLVDGGDVRPAKDLDERRRRQRRKGTKGLPYRKGGADRISIPGVYPAIVDAVTFQAAQARLSRNGERRRAADPERWPLGGMLPCGHCGEPVWCTTSHARGERRRLALCSRKRTLGDEGCPGGGRLPYDAVLARVAAMLTENLGTEQARGSLRRSLERLTV